MLLYYSKELKLNERQLDTLMAKCRRIKTLEYERIMRPTADEFDRWLNETRELSRTLTSEQLSAYFRLINLATEERYAEENLGRLKKYKPLFGLNEKQVKADLTAYELISSRSR